MPVLLKGLPLPAEACYTFKDPTDTSSNYVNHPVFIEIFFGDNGSDPTIYLWEFFPSLIFCRPTRIRATSI
jgi:hypothetical protein